MKNNLKECPFCGCEEVTVSVQHNKQFLWSGIVMCNHCQASGSVCSGNESEEEAQQAAIENWNSACRPNPYRIAMVRKWNTFWRSIYRD